MWHNETMNVWTHLIGKLCFLGILIYLLTCVPNMKTLGEKLEIEVRTKLRENPNF